MNMFKSTKAKTPKEYIESLPEPRRSQVKELDKLISELAKGYNKKLYGSIIGYGSFRYQSRSGQEGEWYIAGLAGQKNYVSIYLSMARKGKYIAEEFKSQLTNTKIGKSCIRITDLDKVDFKILQKAVRENFKEFENQKKLGKFEGYEA